MFVSIFSVLHHLYTDTNDGVLEPYRGTSDTVPEAVIVGLVLHDGVGWKVKNSSQSVSNSRRGHLVA